MNENINLVEILKDCPKGTKLYSPLAGKLIFECIEGVNLKRIVTHHCDDVFAVYTFTEEGKYFSSKDSECLLFPSKDRRDWSKFKPKKPKFDPKTLQPFDKILFRDIDADDWTCSFFSHICNYEERYKCHTTECRCVCCIPYNDETKHLVGTSDEAPEYYRYWEE